MDFEQLLKSIGTARAAAQEDAAAFAREPEALRSQKRTGEMLGCVVAQRAAEAVEVALSRILGETRTRADA